ILHVRNRNRNAALPLFRRLVDLVVRRKRREVLLRQSLRDRCRQRRLAMVHVPDRAYVQVRLVANKFFLGHRLSLRRSLVGVSPLITFLSVEPTTRIERVTSSLPRTCSG